MGWALGLRRASALLTRSTAPRRRSSPDFITPQEAQFAVEYDHEKAPPVVWMRLRPAPLPATLSLRFRVLLQRARRAPAVAMRRADSACAAGKQGDALARGAVARAGQAPAPRRAPAAPSREACSRRRGMPQQRGYPLRARADGMGPSASADEPAGSQQSGLQLSQDGSEARPVGPVGPVAPPPPCGGRHQPPLPVADAPRAAAASGRSSRSACRHPCRRRAPDGLRRPGARLPQPA